MKIRLHWSEKFEVVRNFPPFDLDSKDYPELELEIESVHEASRGDSEQLGKALEDLQYKKHHSPAAGSLGSDQARGETIMDIVKPYPWSERHEEEGELVGGFNFVGSGVS